MASGSRRGTTDLLDDIVRGARSNGIGLKLGNDGFDATLRVRHVSVINFPTQVYLYGGANQARFQAADSTILGDTTDLVLDGPLATADLTTTDLSAPHTSFVNGAQASQLTHDRSAKRRAAADDGGAAAAQLGPDRPRHQRGGAGRRSR